MCVCVRVLYSPSVLLSVTLRGSDTRLTAVRHTCTHKCTKTKMHSKVQKVCLTSALVRNLTLSDTQKFTHFNCTKCRHASKTRKGAHSVTHQGSFTTYGSVYLLCDSLSNTLMADPHTKTKIFSSIQPVNCV